VSVQDYQFNMTGASGVSIPNSQLNVTNTNTGNTWGATVNNAQASGYGLLSQGQAGYGVEGTSVGSWGVVGSGAGGVLWPMVRQHRGRSRQHEQLWDLWRQH
jgi:hypothetical protein